MSSPLNVSPRSILSTLVSGVCAGFNAALILLLPVECGGCATPDERFCAQCRTRLAHDTFEAEQLQRPVDAPFPVFAAVDYAGLARTCVLNFKEHGRTDLRRPLADLLHRAVQAAQRAHPAAELWCVPVPSTARSVAKRGYRHVDLLLRAMPTPAAPQPWLRASATRHDQVGLSVVERQLNAAHTFSVHPSLKRRNALAAKRVLLIDDVVTTGSSLCAAAQALEAAGATVVAGAVVAHTKKLGGIPQP